MSLYNKRNNKINGNSRATQEKISEFTYASFSKRVQVEGERHQKNWLMKLLVLKEGAARECGGQPTPIFQASDKGQICKRNERPLLWQQSTSTVAPETTNINFPGCESLRTHHEAGKPSWCNAKGRACDSP